MADLKGFLNWAEETITSDEYDDLACEYLTYIRNDAKPKTTQRKKTALKSFARWAAIPVPHLTDYTGPTPGRPVPHPLPEGIDGVKRLLRVCDTDEEKALVGLCGMAGLRVSEARSVCWDNVDLETMMLEVRGKGDKTRHVPISPSLLPLLAAIVDTSRPSSPFITMPDRTARRAITRMGRRALLQRRISSHDLRATFATAAYSKTKDIRVVQVLLGHADSRTTEAYIGVQTAALHAAADLFREEDAA